MINVYGVRSTISLASVNTALTSSMTSVYGFHSSGTIGSATGGVGTITNYYGLYLSPLTIGATGVVTNRWGLYLSDPLMKNHIVGTTLIGTAVDNEIDKLQVTGSVKSTSSVQVGNSVVTASATNVGAIRYRADANNSYMDMVMQTGASTYEWVNVVQNTWV